MKIASTVLAASLLLTAAAGAARSETAEPPSQAAATKVTQGAAALSTESAAEKGSAPGSTASATEKGSAPRSTASAADKGAHQAKQHAAISEGSQKAANLPFLEELDKIDDVNPYVIKSVIIEGNKLISRGQIKAVVKTKPGDFYHRKDMEADLKNIYQMGYFDGQQMHVVAETTAAGMVINIKLKENPFLKKVTFAGNKIVPTEKMQELFKEQVQKPRSSTQISKATKAIEEMYKSQGYLLAHVSCGKDEPEGTMPVIIDEGNLKEIKISGLSDDQKKIVLETLTLKAGEPYNEKQLTRDLITTINSGKVEKLQRQVDKSKAGGGYILTISPLPASREQTTKTAAREQTVKAATEPLLDGGKSKPALPVLNRLIKSPMYKSIKQAN